MSQIAADLRPTRATPVVVRFLVVAVLVAMPLSAHADPEETEPGTTRGDAPTPNRINMRLGSATTDSTGRPTICLDVRVWAGLGIESCGTGQAIIHNDPGKEIAHFRATWSLFERGTSSGTGRVRGGIGFAELQSGVDHLGFHFNEPDPVDRGSVTGPEAVVQGQWLVPIGKGVEAIASFTAGLAMFANADKLATPQSNLQPFASAEFGIGW